MFGWIRLALVRPARAIRVITAAADNAIVLEDDGAIVFRRLGAAPAVDALTAVDLEVHDIEDRAADRLHGIVDARLHHAVRQDVVDRVAVDHVVAVDIARKAQVEIACAMLVQVVAWVISGRDDLRSRIDDLQIREEAALMLLRHIAHLHGFIHAQRTRRARRAAALHVDVNRAPVDDKDRVVRDIVVAELEAITVQGIRVKAKDALTIVRVILARIAEAVIRIMAVYDAGVAKVNGLVILEARL